FGCSTGLAGVSHGARSHFMFVSIATDCRNGHMPFERFLACSSLPGCPKPAAILGHTSPGTTGFDVVDSWGWLRVEVPGGLVKHPGNNKCESFRFPRLWPGCLTSS